MVVDAFVVASMDAEPCDTGILPQSHSNVSDHVFNEHRIVVGLHSDVTLVWPLEQRIDRARRRSFCHIDDLLDPYPCRWIGRITDGAHFDRQVTTLIVRSVVTDLL